MTKHVCRQLAASMFSDAAAARSERSYRLTDSQETFGANPEPHKAWLSVSSLASHLTSTVSDFSVEWNMMRRMKKMTGGAALDKIKVLAHLLKRGSLPRGLEEGARKHIPRDRNWSQHAEWSEAMAMLQQDPNQWEVEEEPYPAEEEGWDAWDDSADWHWRQEYDETWNDSEATAEVLALNLI